MDSTHIYWTEGGAYSTGTGSVKKVPIDGSAVTTLVLGETGPYALAVDTESVYWVSNGDAVKKVALGGGTPTTLASGQNNPFALAVDATSVYWVNGGTPRRIGSHVSPPQPTSSGSVMSVPRAGGTPTELVSGLNNPYAIAVDDATVYWVNYYGDGAYGDGTVMKVPLAGGTPTTLATGQRQPTAIAVDGSNVYWTTSNAIMRVPLGGGTATPVVSGQPGPTALALDANQIYWTNRVGSVARAPLAGGTPLSFAWFQGDPIGIAATATRVYWVNYDYLNSTGGASPIMSGCSNAGCLDEQVCNHDTSFTCATRCSAQGCPAGRHCNTTDTACVGNCTPNCAPGMCGGFDGCGGTCVCPSSAPYCRSGVCSASAAGGCPCTATNQCSGAGEICCGTTCCPSLACFGGECRGGNGCGTGGATGAGGGTGAGGWVGTGGGSTGLCPDWTNCIAATITPSSGLGKCTGYHYLTVTNSCSQTVQLEYCFEQASGACHCGQGDIAGGATVVGGDANGMWTCDGAGGGMFYATDPALWGQCPTLSKCR